jgi:hypothetical protein
MTFRRDWQAVGQRRYGLRCFARNDEVGSSDATKELDGQITKSLSTPSHKNIPLNPSGKSMLFLRASHG